MVQRAGGLIDAADFGTAGGVTVALSGGVTDGNTDVWLQGGLAGIEFECKFGTAVHGATIGTVPVGYRPGRIVTVGLTPNSADPDSVFIQIQTTGVINLFFYGTVSAASSIRGNASWPKAS